MIGGRFAPVFARRARHLVARVLGAAVFMGVPSVANAETRADSAFANALRIARKLHDERMVASLLSGRALAPAASPVEIEEAVAAYEDMADPDAAAALLRRRVERYPRERLPLTLLADLCARSDRGDEAIARYEEAKERFGLTPPESLKFARVLAKRGKLTRALEVLRESIGRSSDPSIDSLRDLGMLAWELDDVGTALAAYSELHARGADSRDDLGRLIALADDAGHVHDAIAFAADRYERESRPEDLLCLGELQQKHGDWVGLSRTLARAAESRAAFAGSERYLRLQVAAYAHDGDLARVGDAYQAIVAIDPTASYAKAGLVWNAIDRHDAAALSRFTRAFSADAAASPDLLAPMAAATGFLGRPREAAGYVALELADAPTDDSLLLDFADALERTGDGNRAARIRRVALSDPATLDVAAPLDDRGIRLFESRALSARANRGADAGDRWLRALTALAPAQATREFAVEWYLADGRNDAARRLMRGSGPSQLGARPAGLSDENGESAEPVSELATPGTGEDAGAGEEETLLDMLDGRRDSEVERRIARRLSDQEPAAADAVLSPLRELAYRHDPTAGAAAAYARLGDLETDQADVSAANDALGLRLDYAGSGRTLSSCGPEVLLPKPRLEGDLLVRGRRFESRGVTELEVGVNVQVDRAAPRLTFFREDRWSRAATTAVWAEGNGLVANETAALRIAGLRDRAGASVTADLIASFYLSAAIEGFDDHTRDYAYAGAGMREEIELGGRIVRDRPDVSLGIAGSALQRTHVRSPPGELSAVEASIDEVLPKSYEAVSAVAHISHGDWSDRYHRDHLDFPRFGCDGSLGVVVASRTFAGLLSCAVIVKLAGATFARGGGVYGFGVVGLPRLAYASLFLSLNQTF